ncbi:MAG: carcinine hydrolase/isopenicillin-N N-acyltransferase family protein [Flavipsychrobacter sp.]
MNLLHTLLLLLTTSLFTSANACSVFYYIDKATGKIYVANNEDYFFDVNAYIQIEPATKDKLANLWYGWDKFAQGGINEAGLFFDGAVTPEQSVPKGHKNKKGNLGRDLLATCHNVTEALHLLEERNIILNNAHMMLGDSTGNAVVVEWLDGVKTITTIKDNRLVMTNFLLADTTQGNYPCYRYNSIIDKMNAAEGKDSLSFLEVSNFLSGAAQPPNSVEGKTGGTLYSTFINISDMKLVLVYQLDNKKVTKLDLKKTFAQGKRRKIPLK